MPNKIVEIRSLVVAFDGFKAVDDISFDIFKGEIFGFLGANGAGKTTTTRVLCGLLVPTSGSVAIAGKTFAEGGNEIKKRVGYMSQKFTLYDDLTIEENLRFKSDLRFIPYSEFKKRMNELFQFIDFKYRPSILVKNLPSGVKQQVSLISTLLHDPDIIFLDEPTSGVSPAMRAVFWKLIRKLAGEGKTIIVTTHYMDEAEECGRIALMSAGKIIALDTPKNLKEKTCKSNAERVTLEDVFVKLVEGSVKI